MKAFNLNWTDTMAGGRRIDPSRPWQRCDGEAVWQDQNGDTILGIKTSPKEVKLWDGKTYPTLYAVGLLRSVETFGYGIYSAEIKMPKGKHLWPAFWLVGEGKWPNNGEIDIVEGYSRNGSYYVFPLSWRTETNVHYKDGTKNMQSGEQKVSVLKQPKNPTEHFINYAVEWRPNKVTFLVNGKKVREVGWDVCQHFAGSKMHVVFDMWTESEDFTIESPMVIRNFKYKEL